MSGLTMNTLVGGLLIRPVSLYDDTLKANSKKEIRTNVSKTRNQIDVQPIQVARKSVETTMDENTRVWTAESDSKSRVSLSNITIDRNLNPDVNVNSQKTNPSNEGGSTSSASWKSTCRSEYCSFQPHSWTALHLVLAGQVFQMTTFTALTGFIAPFLKSVGFTSNEIATQLTIIGAVDCVGRLVHGLLVSWLKLNTARYASLCLVLGSSSLLICALVPQTVLVSVLSVATMMFYGVMTNFLVVLVIECVGPEQFAASVPLSGITFAIVMFVVPTLFGKFDSLIKYTTYTIFDQNIVWFCNSL